MTSSGKDMAAPSEPGPTVPRDLQMIATVRGLSRAAVRILAWASPRPLGTLFTASEGSGSIRAITPTGGVSVVTTVSGGAEMLSFVPLNLGSSGNPVEGFYASAFPRDVVTAGASQFAGLLGDLVVTSEFSHTVTTSPRALSSRLSGSSQHSPRMGSS